MINLKINKVNVYLKTELLVVYYNVLDPIHLVYTFDIVCSLL